MSHKFSTLTDFGGYWCKVFLGTVSCVVVLYVTDIIVTDIIPVSAYLLGVTPISGIVASFATWWRWRHSRHGTDAFSIAKYWSARRSKLRLVRGRASLTNILVLGLIRIGLSGIGWLFILLAISFFLMGLKEHIVLLLGLIGQGTLDFSQLGNAFLAFVFPLGFGVAGGAAIAAANRIRLRATPVADSETFRSPVVYLRSFQADKDFSMRRLALGRLFSLRTEEEQLAQALNEIGPVVAIGRPGEILPRLGANRFYFEDDEWQEQVLTWFGRAALVVLHAPSKPTEGVTWEIGQCLSNVSPDKFVFLIPQNRSCLDCLNASFENHGFNKIPVEKLPRSPYGSHISGIAYFTRDKRCEFSPLVKPPFFFRPFSSPLVQVYRLAFKPVITRIAGSWKRPPRAFGEASILIFWILVCAVGMHLAISDIRPWIQEEQRQVRGFVQTMLKLIEPQEMPGESVAVSRNVQRQLDTKASLEPPASELVSKSAIIAQKVREIVKDIVQQAHTEAMNTAVELEKLDLVTILLPRTLLNKSGTEQNRAKLRRWSELVEQDKTVSHSHSIQFEARISDLMGQEHGAEFLSEVARNRKYTDSDLAQIFANQKAIIEKITMLNEFMAARLGHVMLQGEQLIFETQKEVDTYNAYINEIQRLEETQIHLEKRRQDALRETVAKLERFAR